MKSSRQFYQDVVPLSKIVKNGIEQEINTPIFPGLGCGFFTVSLILPSIRRACAVMIAPPLCAHNARLMVSHWERSSMDIENNLVFFIYEEDDIIHGASEEIKNALIDIYSEKHPDVLFVVSSCLPEIVGEDIEAVVRQVSTIVTVPVLFIKTENFTNLTAKQGVENTISSFLDLMGDKTESLESTVNIIGSNAKEFPDTELFRILIKAGFSVNVIFPSQCDLTILKNAPKAQFNILMNRHSLLLAEQMKIKYNIPYFFFEQVYTPESILSKYHELGQFIGVDLNPFVQEKFKNFEIAIQNSKERLENSSIIISFSSGRIFDMAQFLRLAGMDVLIIGVNELNEDDLKDAEILYNSQKDIGIVRNISWYPIDECIAHLQPDYFYSFVGPECAYCARHGVKHRNIVTRPRFNGFEEAERILDTLLKEKPGYSTLILKEKMLEKVETS